MKQIQEEEDGDVRDGEKPLRGQLQSKIKFGKKKTNFSCIIHSDNGRSSPQHNGTRVEIGFVGALTHNDPAATHWDAN